MRWTPGMRMILRGAKSPTDSGSWYRLTRWRNYPRLYDVRGVIKFIFVSRTKCFARDPAFFEGGSLSKHAANWQDFLDKYPHKDSTWAKHIITTGLRTKPLLTKPFSNTQFSPKYNSSALSHPDFTMDQINQWLDQGVIDHGFLHILLHNDDINLYCFEWNGIFYRFLVMPWGTKYATAIENAFSTPLPQDSQ